MKKITIFIIILLGSALILQAQERSTFSPEDMDFETNYGHFNFWEVKLHTGGHVTSREEVEDILSNGYTGIELLSGCNHPDASNGSAFTSTRNMVSDLPCLMWAVKKLLVIRVAFSAL